jgi:pimeloyl-ACP methyl ester carboxylesterase
MSESVARVRGRLAPSAMFPAGRADIRVRRVALPGGLVLRVAEAGDPAAPPVVLLHGWGASLYMWRAWFAPLADHGFRVVAVDLPGHGLSDAPMTAGAYTLVALLEVVRQFLAVEGLVGAPVIAQSMAGSIALELALANPSAAMKLVLVNAAAFGRIGLQRLARLASPPATDLLGQVFPRWIVARAHRLAYAAPERVTAHDVDEYWAPSQSASYWRAMRRLLHEFSWQRAPAERLAPRLATLAHRPLVVVSGRDRLVRDARPYLASLEQLGAPLTLLHLPDGGHAVNEEEPTRLIPVVLDYLR